jgi:hypothetical protein
MKKFVICYDIDSTIAKSDQFANFIETKPKNWAAFHAGIPHYTPLPLIEDCRHQIGMPDMYSVVFSTARNVETRQPTLEWLSKHLGASMDLLHLFMRGKNDYRPDVEVKSDNLDLIEHQFGKVSVAYEDVERVQELYRSRGIRVRCPIKNVWLEAHETETESV